MTVTPIKPPPEQGTHFWFMSIQTTQAQGVWVASYQGATTPKRGETRLDMFNRIRADLEAQEPRNRGGLVLAFDVQPNQI